MFFTGGAAARGHGDEAAAVFCEVQQRELVFQHEDAQVHLAGADQFPDEGEHILGDAGAAALDHGGGESDFHWAAMARCFLKGGGFSEQIAEFHEVERAEHGRSWHP